MAVYFGYIFWGLIFVFLHFKINGFDLLPDVIGFVLVAMGAYALRPLSPKFGLAGSLSSLLAVGWLVGLAVSGEAGLPFGMLMTCVNCAMIWSLLGGVMDYTLANDRHDLAAQAHTRRVFYVALMAGMWLLTFAALNSRDLAGVAAILGIVAMVTILVLVLRLIYRVRYEVASR